MQQVGQCCVGAKICRLWTIKASNWHQRSGTWTLSAAPHLPFFLAWEVPEGIIDSFQITKSNNLRPKKWFMLIVRWNKKFPQRRKWRLDIDWVCICMEVGGACTSGIWTDDPLYWSNKRRQTLLSQNSCDLQILRWALTYITKTSKHNFRGLVLHLFLQLSSCVFLSLPVSHSNGGHPYSPPSNVENPCVYFKINEKVPEMRRLI